MSNSASGLHQDLETQLRETRSEWSRRLEAIQTDRRRGRGALEPDFAEQAVQRENDETLDALDARGRQELEAIDAALQRIAAGSFGVCVQCGEEIAEARLRAQPTAASCVPCAGAGR